MHEASTNRPKTHGFKTDGSKTAGSGTGGSKAAPKAPALAEPTAVPTSLDIEEFARNLARMVEEGGRALAAYLKPREEGRMHGEYAEFVDVVKTLGHAWREFRHLRVLFLHVLRSDRLDVGDAAAAKAGQRFR